MGTPLSARDGGGGGGGVAVLSGAVNPVDSSSSKPSLGNSEQDSPILFFLFFHKAIRMELDALHRSAMAFATRQLLDLHPLLDRYRFLRSIYQHHSSAEDEVRFNICFSFFTSSTIGPPIWTFISYIFLLNYCYQKRLRHNETVYIMIVISFHS